MGGGEHWQAAEGHVGVYGIVGAGEAWYRSVVDMRRFSWKARDVSEGTIRRERIV